MSTNQVKKLSTINEENGCFSIPWSRCTNPKTSPGAIIKDIMDRKMNPEFGQMFIKSWDELSEFFDESTLSKTLKLFKVRNFADFEYVQTENSSSCSRLFDQGYPLVTVNGPVLHYVTEYYSGHGGGWERKVNKLCHEFIVPSYYQTFAPKFISAALMIQFPYLKKYRERMKVYTMHGAKEFYLSIDEPEEGKTKQWGSRSLYIPFRALKERDAGIITQRHTSYWKGYFGKGGYEQELAHQLSTLEPPVAQEFMKDVEWG